MSEEQIVTLPDGFILMSEKWPRYAQEVIFFRKDGTSAVGRSGDNGVYFGLWAGKTERHKDMLGWKPLEKEDQ